MIDGSLDQLHLGDLLQWLQMGVISGRLTLVEQGRRRRLDFHKGKVVYATSAVPQERLANLLAASGDIPVDKLKNLLGLSLLRRTIFTDLLLRDGLVSAEELRTCLTRQAEIVMQQVLKAPKVSFELDTSYPEEQHIGLRLDLEPTKLLLSAARLSDEADPDDEHERVSGLVCSDADLDELFWGLIGEGISAEDQLDGQRLVELHRLIHDILGTLSQWMASSPGLVPLPSGQVTRITDQMAAPRGVRLEGLPQAVWNQMVLACSVRSVGPELPRDLAQLEEHANDLDLWFEITACDTWARPHASRLDELSKSVATLWARAAAAAAEHLDIEPGVAALAAHLAVVPTDLVLWVLTTLPVPHLGLRQTLLRTLPKRLGTCLAQMADFPQELLQVLNPDLSRPTRLGACLYLSRAELPSASVWPLTVGDDEGLMEMAPPARIASASGAAREAIESSHEDQIAVG